MPSGPFDLVYSFGVIHHTPNPKRVLESARERVGAGASLKLMVYNRHSWKVAGIVLGHGQRTVLAGRRADRTTVRSSNWLSCHLHLHASHLGDLVTEPDSGWERYVDHIFPYRVKDYVQYRYRRHFLSMPPPSASRALERHFGWHLLLMRAVS